MDNFSEPENLTLVSEKCRLMNGDLYKIRASGSIAAIKIPPEQNSNTEHFKQIETKVDAKKYLVLDDLCGKLIRVDEHSLLSKSKLKHAWAITIHKFQGSEVENVVYCLTGSKMENWQHVYTAVTRGKKNVMILGSYAELLKAVKKSPIPRQTTLKEKIKRMLSSSCPETPGKVLGSRMEQQLDLASPKESPLKRKAESKDNPSKKKLF